MTLRDLTFVYGGSVVYDLIYKPAGSKKIYAGIYTFGTLVKPEYEKIMQIEVVARFPSQNGVLRLFLASR